MKIIFYLGHPAHFHLFKLAIQGLKNNGHDIQIVIRKKDVLEDLLNLSELEYINILPRGRRDDTISLIFGVLRKDIALFRIARAMSPDLLIGTSAEITHVGKILRIPSVVVNEDDYDVVPRFSRLAYPFADCILAPTSCRVGKWGAKAVQYNGYHELAYLHPKHFVPQKGVIESFNPQGTRYFILRFAKLSAHHDTGRRGIDKEVARCIIEQLLPFGNIYISSERELEPFFERYRIDLNPIDIHHALYFADLYIGDSQTMAAEAAVLGTPALRFNDFVGEIGYLEELEHKHKLTYGIKASFPQKLYEKIRELLSMPDLQEIWQSRRTEMLKDKIDVAEFLIWWIENYPSSITEIRTNENYLERFK